MLVLTLLKIIVTLMAYGARKSERVNFANPIKVHIMAIDGTWRRNCELLDVSSTGARLLVEGSLEGLQLKEFFSTALLDGSRIPPLRNDPHFR